MQTYQTKRKAPDRAVPPVQEAAPSKSEMLHLSGAGAPQPMSPALREKFEPGFSADFSNIRISRGHIPEELGVRAVAQGTDILLDQSAGMDVLGHELAHVVQQAQGRVEGGFPVVENAALEHEADVMGARAASGLSAQMGSENGFGGEAMSIAPMSAASAPAQCKSRAEKKAEKEAEKNASHARAVTKAREQRDVFLKDKYYRGHLLHDAQARGNHADITDTNRRRFVERNMGHLSAGSEGELQQKQDEMYQAFYNNDRKKMGSYVRKEFDRLGGKMKKKGELERLFTMAENAASDEEFIDAFAKLEPLQLDVMPTSDMMKPDNLSPADMGLAQKDVDQFRKQAANYASRIGPMRARAKALRANPDGTDYKALGTAEEIAMQSQPERSPYFGDYWDQPAAPAPQSAPPQPVAPPQPTVQAQPTAPAQQAVVPPAQLPTAAIPLQTAQHTPPPLPARPRVMPHPNLQNFRRPGSPPPPPAPVARRPVVPNAKLVWDQLNRRGG